MLNVIDKDLQGVVMIFDGPIEMLNVAKGAHTSYGLGPKYCDSLTKANPEASAKVQAMVEELNELEDFAPPNRRKRRRWDEVEGTADIDRALDGDSAMFRRSKKRPNRGPTDITLLANLDGHCDMTKESIFWRGAMAVALTTLLDDLGYTVTVWVWNTGRRVFKHPYSNQYTACRLKEPGSDLDPTNLMNCLTADFMRRVMFGTFGAGAHGFSEFGSMSNELDGLLPYLDITDDHIITLPQVFNRAHCISLTRLELKRITDKC